MVTWTADSDDRAESDDDVLTEEEEEEGDPLPFLKEGKKCQEKNPDSNTINYCLVYASHIHKQLCSIQQYLIKTAAQIQGLLLNRKWVHAGLPNTRPLLAPSKPINETAFLKARQQVQGAEKEPNNLLTDYQGLKLRGMHVQCLRDLYYTLSLALHHVSSDFTAPGLMLLRPTFEMRRCDTVSQELHPRVSETPFPPPYWLYCFFRLLANLNIGSHQQTEQTIHYMTCLHDADRFQLIPLAETDPDSDRRASTSFPLEKAAITFPITAYL
ncbi:hypothetical protein GBF38_008828 [Nibea albiflora]|uniref:Uncharacterized protein n=1 Tax=Nibea albiflora TaxID=240163 RepID=A0ACB7EQQ7_NIBAL|nr:hypothetical protein GBF38_008828 [Nibea albiflora]